MKLSDYIQGQRKGKEAHRLEKEAMKDPFLADALDGYHRIEGNHEEILNKLRRQIAFRSGKTRKKRAVRWSIAACLLVLLSVGGYFLFPEGMLTKDRYARVKPVSGKEMYYEEECMASEPDSSGSIVAKMVSSDTAPQTSSAQIGEKKKSNRTTPSSTASVPQTDEYRIVAEENALCETEYAALFDETESGNAAVGIQTQNAVPSSGEIRGKVVDRNGEPLPGASVTLTDSGSATITDTLGNFTLIAVGDKAIQVDYIGYEPVTLPVDTAKNIQIVMNESLVALNEVTVTEVTGKRVVPEPVTGKRKYRKYLKENLVRPIGNECAGVKGNVTITFHVNGQGRPFDLVIEKSLCVQADEEVMRLIQEGPDWTPGNQRACITVKF